jgi:hypothetical protein
LFFDFLQMIHCWKKNHFESAFVVFVPVTLEFLVDLLAIMNFQFSHQFAIVDFDYPMLHFLSHSMIYY